jgi:hypothetical protein
MLTGYWVPTNEMLRPWSRNPAQNPNGWVGENWEGLGYDVVSYFPEFPAGSGERGVGDFEVDKKDTREDFARITSQIHPIAIISFGKGDGPWEIETNAPPTEMFGKKYKNTLPFDMIRDAVNQSGQINAWVDRQGDAGNFLCGYLSHLGARYKSEHSDPTDPDFVLAQGFIHVGTGYSMNVYTKAVEATLRATIQYMNQSR